MRTARSPYGPWTPSSATAGGSCGMPTAAFHPNGTLYVVCGNGATLHSAPSRDGPWSPLQVRLPQATDWEDPTLWFDRRGNFHIVNHVYSLAPFSAGEYTVASGHIVSRDGLE